MTAAEFAGLTDGDIVRHGPTGDYWLVVGTTGTAPALIPVTVPGEPLEWDLVPGSRPAEDPELARILAEARDDPEPP